MTVKSAAVCTLGCKVNQYDTDALLHTLAARGVTLRNFDEPADLYIINTCTVTHISDRKSRQMIRRARRLNPAAIVAACGCLARLEPAALQEAGADFAFDARHTDSLFEALPGFMTDHLPGDIPVEPCMPATDTNIPVSNRRTRAYIKIQEGCDRFCAYCIVPYARGTITSKPPAEVLSEARALVQRGVKEIVLTGIHVASYGKDVSTDNADQPLPALLKEVANLDGLMRLRLGSLEPCAVNDPFIEAVRTLPRLCDHFHLSLQSGCDRTLQRMNRRYTTDDYAQADARLRAVYPDAALTTDIIVGFPGETEADFETSMQFVESMRFARVHVFEYSPRAGTPAATFPEQIPSPVKTERGQRMRTLTARMARDFQAAQVGRTWPVLFETEHDGYWEGHTTHYMAVRVRDNRPLGNLIEAVRVTDAADGVLYGHLV